VSGTRANGRSQAGIIDHPMSYTVLARKYRPQKFSDVIGQDHVTRTLKNALEQQRIAHGYIFSGHRGIGKTTIARILAMALNCKSSDKPVTEPCGVCESCREIREGSVGAMDVIEIDAATNRGIEDVRGIIATATAEPARDRYRIFILDEAHQVTDAAFNALLKTLEEPPPWVVFMMATTQPEDIPQTIRSRSQHFSFHAVKFDDIIGQLRSISDAENLKVDDDALAMLAEAGDGSMRDALSIMDQAISCCGTTLTSELVRGLIGSVSSDVLEQVMKAVAKDSSEEVLRIVDKLITEGHSASHFMKQFVRFLRNCIVAKIAGGETSLLQISSDEKQRVMRTAELFTEEDLTRFLQITLRTHGDVSFKQEQRFHLELGMLKLVHAKRLLPIEELLSGAKLETAASAPPQTTGARTAPPSMSAARNAPPSFGSRPTPPSAGGSPFGAPKTSSATSRPSPFEADKARKSKTELSGGEAESDAAATPTPVAQTSPIPTMSRTTPPPMASTPRTLSSVFPPKPQPGKAEAPSSTPIQQGTAVAVAVEEQIPAQASADGSVDAIREAVITALEAGGSRMAVATLEEGEWSMTGAVVNVVVAMSAAMIDVTFGAEQKKMAASTASRIAGKPVRVNIVSGNPKIENRPVRKSSGGGNAKGRAADEPLVKKMMEKFGAEIRTVIDQS
jgi:DNA polymerase III subunit gamma/tau